MCRRFTWVPALLRVVIFIVFCGESARAQNVVQEENRLPGTRDWVLTKLEPAAAGQSPSSPDDQFRRRRAIEGYCSRASVRAGETLTVYVSMNPPGRFKFDLYRMGYYNGDGGRLVTSIASTAGVTQPDPEDGPNKLIECRWQPTLVLAVPREWVSGVYLGKLTAEGSGYEVYVVFIVRDDRPADLLFQCSDITWQTYNRWPAWRSLYDYGNNKWHTKVGNDVGFDRPYGLYYNGLPSRFQPITNGSGEFLLWEFPLAFWLEQHGYDVTYISNLDTHARPETLTRAKGFLSVGHDEYWTQQMIENVTRARDAGVNLAFLSGNSLSTKIYLRPASDGRADRVLGRIESFGDEEELMGDSSYGVGMADWVCTAPDHWLYAGTGMKVGERIPKLIGWEYHGLPLIEDPAPTVLARSAIEGKPNAPEHAAVIYPGPKGNFVFNAGTCWWNMLLSKPPAVPNPNNRDFSKPDPRVQRITKNLMDRIVSGKERASQ